jgi:hypothetical protein
MQALLTLRVIACVYFVACLVDIIHLLYRG